MLLSDNYKPFLLIVGSALLFLFGLGWRDLWAPVEPRYAEIARVMFARGEWIVPTVNGNLYTDKPILYFWLVLLASKAVGAVNEWTLRLPAALGGVGFVWATYLIGKEFFTARVGFLSAVILATSMRVIWEARWAHIDMLFCAFFALSLYCAMRSLLRPANPNAILLAYVFMALATLAKGLIGVVLPALLWVSFALARRDWQVVRAAKLHLGIPLFLMVTAPWFLLVNHATDGKWLSDFLYIHHLQRYTAGAGHRQPFYYYLTTLPLDFLPWTIFLVPALIALRSYQRLWNDPVGLFLILWFGTVLGFFSQSDTKRELYLLPLLPTLALFAGNYFDRLGAGTIPDSSFSRRFVLSNLAVIAIVGAALPAAAWFVHREALWISVPAGLTLAGGGALAIFFLKQRRPPAVVTTVALMMTLVSLTAAWWVLPYVDRFKSRRPLALEINQRVPRSAPLYIYADTMNDFNFYLERDEMPVLAAPADIEKLLRGATTSYILIKDRDLKRLEMISPQWVLFRGGTGSTTWNLLELKARLAG